MWVRSTLVASAYSGPPDLGQQRAVRQQPPAVAHQRAQQLELDRRQVDLLAGDASRAARRGRAPGRRPRAPARRPPRRRAAARPAGARRARRARTAWSRSRRRRPRSARTFSASSSTADSTMIGISLHSRSRRHTSTPSIARQHQVDDRRLGRAHGGAVQRLLPGLGRDRPRSPRRAGRRAARAGSAGRRRRRARARRSCGARAPASPARAGSSMTNVVPCPGSDSTATCPPLASTKPAGDRQAEPGAARRPAVPAA